jgi:DMSO/TMAO reductase YedYZ molybdopterin-dependent catalytic subunit
LDFMGGRAKTGALVGALTAALFAAVGYLGWTLAGFPFAPFDLFDWVARELPGSMITLWIDAAVAVLPALHAGSTSGAAKGAEQLMAVASFIAVGSALSAAVFAALGVSDEPGLLLGAIGGAGAGAAATLIEWSLGRLRASSNADAVWTVSTFLVWGVALGWIHDRWRARPIEPPGAAPVPLDRRRFLQSLAWLTAGPSAITAAWAITTRRGHEARGARWSDTHALPNAGAAVQPMPGTRPEFTPLERHYRIDIDTRPPVVNPITWRLRIGGLFERPREWTIDDLRREASLDQFITLACVSNPLGGDLIGTTRWTGVSLRQILEQVQPRRDATHLRMQSADGFFEFVPIQTVLADPRVMLAYAWDGVPLPAEHGFPLRVYVPDVYGMKQPKWIVAIDAVSRWEPGYWVMRGWDRDGRVVATSVVDTARADSSRRHIIAGGIAYAGARQVSRVQVRVDAGEWEDAQLRDPLAITTWAVWYAGPAAGPGRHTVSVRCFDGNGSVQPAPFHARQVSI